MTNLNSNRLCFVGFLKKPFDYYDLDDRLLIESMQRFRSEQQIVFCDWDSIDTSLHSSEAFDILNGSYTQHNLNDSDVIIFLEIPYRISNTANQDRVSHLLIIMQSYLTIPTINPLQSFFDYPDKSYLLRFPDLPFPKTVYVDNSSNLEEVLSGFADEVIVKPLDGGGGYRVIKIKNDPKLLRDAINNGEPHVAQEFVPEIRDGEKSLLFFNKQFRYGVLKQPNEKDFRSNEIYCQKICRYYPTISEIEISRRALKAFNSQALLERVDLAGSKIMEMTMECPGLYVNFAEVYDDIGMWFYELVDSVLKQPKPIVTYSI